MKMFYLCFNKTSNFGQITDQSYTKKKKKDYIFSDHQKYQRNNFEATLNKNQDQILN